MAASYQDFTGTTSKVKDFTFPYIKQSDIKVRKTTAAGVVTELVEGVLTSQSPGQYTWTNATRITINDAPVSGDTIRVYRDTASDALVGTFYPGSAIRSSDLNDNFTQNLYVTQEAEDSVDSAVTDAASAKTTATTANTTAAAAETKADTAISTANTASTNATSAVSTANTASTNATNAVNTANAASTTATSAEAAVSSVLPYTIVANKAALLSASVTQDDIYEVTDTTDLEDLGGGSDVIWVNSAGATSGQDIAALKPNVTWDSGITLKMKKYGTNNSDRKWIFQSYFANDPETKYASAASPTFTGTPAAPTASASTNTTQIATTAFVVAEIADEVGTTVQAYDADLTSLSSCQSGGAAALAALTSTEIGIIDGATVTTAELNKLDGFTGDKDDLIYAKDLKATGVTTTEFDYLDGVTSAIQTQLDAKGVGDAVLASDQSWSGAQRGTINALTSAATVTIDFNAGNNYSITLGHNAAFANPTNQTAGQSGSIFLTQDGTGSRVPTWGANWHFAGGTAPTLTTTAAAVDRVDYIIAASTKIHAVASLDIKVPS